MQGHYVATGNSKLGKAVGTVNRLPGTTCPGASKWCAATCYAKKGRFPMVHHFYSKELAIPGKLPAFVRWHASGDFDTPEYIALAIDTCKANPNTLFWGYTRSWRVSSLLPLLEQLRALPNVQLFASVDPTISEQPPTGWRRAWIAGMSEAKGPVCMQQRKLRNTCADCGYCFRGRRGDIQFRAH